MLNATWPTTIPEAIALQEQLRKNVVVADAFGDIDRVAGVDVGFEGEGKTARAAVVVLSFPELRPLEFALARGPTPFPYVPGLLSFREIPVVLDALAQLAQPPDLLICDGQGIAHPRRLGIASHLGLIVDIPAIGCAKSLLIGHHPRLPLDKGARVPLTDRDEQIGVVLRTRDNTRPVYVSPGHRVSIASAVDFVLRCTTKYRLPETTRAAHDLASNKVLPRFDKP
jgi:deoxyribonuclease V